MHADAGRIRSAGEHLRALIDNVLDMAKIEAASLEIRPQEFNLVEFVQEVAAMARPLVESNANRFDLRMSALPQVVTSDPMRVRQVLLNLLGNAAKFTRDGTVTLELEPAPVSAGEAAIVIRVRDSGTGIAPGEIERMFEPFRQGGAASGGLGGTGLGLPIVRELCHLLGGCIEAESTLGSGSTFTVTLPVTSPRGCAVE